MQAPGLPKFWNSDTTGTRTYGGAWWLSVQAPHVYVATIGGGLHVVDATDPTAPRQVNHLPTGALGGISPGNPGTHPAPRPPGRKAGPARRTTARERNPFTINEKGMSQRRLGG